MDNFDIEWIYVVDIFRGLCILYYKAVQGIHVFQYHQNSLRVQSELD